MKNGNRIKKYGILLAMRNNIFKKTVFISALSVLALFGTSMSACADTVLSANGENVGRIRTVCSGLILVRSNRTDLTFYREVPNDYFEDAVVYKKYFFSKRTMRLNGRVESLDRLNAIILTPAGKVEIQRYKIKDILMKVPNKG